MKKFLKSDSSEPKSKLSKTFGYYYSKVKSKFVKSSSAEKPVVVEVEDEVDPANEKKDEGNIPRKRVESKTSSEDSIDPHETVQSQDQEDEDHKLSELSFNSESATAQENEGLPLFAQSRKPPPKLAPRKPIEFYRTESNKLRRVYRNRCERYCMGPVSVLVDAIGTTVLAIVNLLLLSMAVVLITVSVMIKEKKTPYGKIVNGIEEHYEHIMRDLGVHVTGKGSDLGEYIDVLAYPLLAVGCVIALVSIVGVFGAILRISIFLNLYSRVSAILLLLEFCAFLYVYDGQPEMGKVSMYNSLDDYRGIAGNNTVTKAWNTIMGLLHCCGVESYLDFLGRENWPPKKINGVHYDLKTPVLCCKERSTDYTCALEKGADLTNNNMETGCYVKAYNFVFQSRVVLITVYLILGLQVIVLLFACWLYWTSGFKATELKKKAKPKPNTEFPSTEPTQKSPQK